MPGGARLAAAFLGVVLGFPTPGRAEEPSGTSGSGAIIVVHADSACPVSDPVVRRLTAILGFPPGTVLDEFAELAHEGSGLSVRLRSKDRRLLGERVLPADDDCEALAQAAAVVLASWLTDAHPEFVVASPVQEDPAPVPASAPPAPPPPAVSAVLATGRVEPVPVFRVRLALSLGAEVGGGDGVPAVAFSAALAPPGAGLGVVARVAFALPQSLALESGEASYSRFPFGVGGVVRLEPGPFGVELQAGPALGWLRVRGVGFSPNHAHNDVTFGIFGAVRAGHPLGAVEPFVEVQVVGWLTQTTVVVDDPARGATLPPVALAFLAGAAFVP